MKEEDSLKGLLAIIKQRLVMIVSFGILGLMLTAVYTFFIVTPMYESTTQLLVNRESDGSTGIQLNDINSNVQMINTYKDIIKGPIILGEVKENLDLDYSVERLTEMVTISANEDSQVFSLIVRGPDADQAAGIANEIAATFQSEIIEIMNVKNVSIISTAAVNSKPISPVVLNNLVIGLALGVLLGTGVAFLRSAMVRTIDDYQFITQTIGWPNLGAISELNKEERAAIMEMRRENAATSTENMKREHKDVQKRIPTEVKTQLEEKPVVVADKKEPEKQKKRPSNNTSGSRERLVTVSEMTREKIGTILQSESVQSVDIRNERGE
ncbi:MAG TPA: Wzz/FepE/Etk N-terminal domain-containing protein [Trichococcus sp.]|nr:Wzz/FepE/Etk N-terminal domain-containing protein [Trichococcus sp.]